MLEELIITGKSTIPKYKQLADALELYIADGHMEINDKIPSVNILSNRFGLSRETVFKSLNILSEKGILVSSYRRGYFVAKTDVEVSYRVFLLMDKMTSFKEDIYESIREELGEKAHVDVFFHHGNIQLFGSLIHENIAAYSHFVIITFLCEDVSEILNKMPQGRLILLDQQEFNLKIDHSQVYQDFESDVYEFLNESIDRIKKYDRIVMVAPTSAPHRQPVVKGFERFCSEIDSVEYLVKNEGIDVIQRNTLYLLIGSKDDNLVKIIKYCRKNNLTLGQDMGIISYNDTQLKEILEGGITVISTDFRKMGIRAAQIIQNNETVYEKNPSKIIIRNSL